MPVLMWHIMDESPSGETVVLRGNQAWLMADRPTMLWKYYYNEWILSYPMFPERTGCYVDEDGQGMDDSLLSFFCVGLME